MTLSGSKYGFKMPRLAPASAGIIIFCNKGLRGSPVIVMTNIGYTPNKSTRMTSYLPTLATPMM